MPPKPGMMPSFVSGSPTAALVDMIRKSVDSAISRPPPRAVPLMAVTVGNGRSSTPLKMALACSSQPMISSSLPANISPNSVMSAPTMKVSLAELTMSPCTPSAPCSASTAAFSSPSVALSNLLTDSAWLSKTSSATPSLTDTRMA